MTDIDHDTTITADQAADELDAIAERLVETRDRLRITRARLADNPSVHPDLDLRIALRLTPAEAAAVKRLLDDHTYTYVGAGERRRLVSVQHRLTGALADLAVEVRR